MKDLPFKLSQVQPLRHAIYADDMTLWSTRGSSGAQEEITQRGLNIIHEHPQSIGLHCVPEKSEFMVVLNYSNKRAGKYKGIITLHINEQPIPRKPHICILGFIWQQVGRSSE